MEPHRDDHPHVPGPSLAPVGFAVGIAVLLTIVLAVLSYIPLRLSLALPAVAAGYLQTPFAHALKLSRGNFWRLFWGSLLTMALPVAGALATYSIDETTRAGFVVANTTVSGLFFAGALIWVGFLSHAYKALAPQSSSSA